MTIRNQVLMATMVTVAVLGFAACGGEGEVGGSLVDDATGRGRTGLAVPGGLVWSNMGREGSALPGEQYGIQEALGGSDTSIGSGSGGAEGNGSATKQQVVPFASIQPDSTPGADGGTQDDPAPPTPEEQQDELSADERHAMTAYQESWDVTFEALDPPRELPKLEKLLTGEALAETLDIIAIRAERKTRVEGSLQTHPTVVSSSDDEVVLDDCGVERSTEYDADGEIIDMADQAAYSYRVRVVHEDGLWKAAEINRRQELCEPV